jgi:hypothetical protein
MEGMWAKMFDPPTVSLATTDQIPLLPQGLIRPCPVPEVMFAAGLQTIITRPHTFQHDLLHGLSVTTWDNQRLEFMVIGMTDVAGVEGGSYPGPTLRMPRGVIFNAEVQGKGPPPHTIHWHGVEPTPINDGVGHCSMELGKYIYQFQPNFMGFYFAHCHRNTMQHFEFGLYFALIFEASDAYFGSIASSDANGSNVVLRNERDANGNLLFPIGGGRDGKRRVACNLDNPLTGLPRFTQFPGFNRRPVDSPDDRPLGVRVVNNVNITDTDVRFPTDPHAMTVPFDVESLMVFDDRDLNWSNLGKNARQTYPAQGTMPGVNDQFKGHAGTPALPGDFFAFNDFNAAYWFVTGVPVPAPKGGSARLPDNVVIPPALNSGISGTQVSIIAETNQTILVRCLNAAYNVLRLTFPVDIVIVAWDGRALGVAPYAHNESYLVPAGTPIEMSVARRFDALIRSNLPISDTIKAEFIDHQSMSPDPGEVEEVVMTALVPINIGGNVQDPPVFAFIGRVVDQLGNPVPDCSVTVSPSTLTGSPLQTVQTNSNGEYTVNIIDGTYEFRPAKAGKVFVTQNQSLTCRNAAGTVPDFVASLADFAPNSYQLPDALDSLREVVGLNPQPTPQAKVFRYDVAPFLDGVPAQDNIIDIRDSLNILRMVVGLPPR